MHYRFAHTTSELARAGYEGSMTIGRHELYRCLLSCIHQLKTCGHVRIECMRGKTRLRWYNRKMCMLSISRCKLAKGITYVPSITMVAKYLLSSKLSPISPHLTRTRRGRPPTIFTAINYSTNPDDKFNLLSRNINLNAYSYLSVNVYN